MNVLVYYPNGCQRRVSVKWLYGIDTVEIIKNKHPEWNFRFVDGEQKDIYKDIDVLLRPNRHDGYPKMIAEAKFLSIPYIWSYRSGKYEDLNIQEIEKQLIDIERSIQKKVFS